LPSKGKNGAAATATPTPASAKAATKTATVSKAAAKATPTPVPSKKAVIVKPVTPVQTKPVTPAPKAAEVAAPAPEKKPAPRPVGANGRRDPFVSPIRTAGPSGPGPNCTGGKRCLSIPELVLQGTVRDISGKMMAVVVTSTRRTYTLRENDQVFNGTVEKITTDSVIFREYVKDPVGREVPREVVKKLGPAS
jgi:hypothetical protein